MHQSATPPNFRPGPRAHSTPNAIQGLLPSRPMCSAMASTSKVTSATASTSAYTTAILGEFSLGLIDPILVDRLGAFRDAMIGITANETSINAIFLWYIPLIRYIQRIE